jgi:putative ABC transport system permease protein
VIIALIGATIDIAVGLVLAAVTTEVLSTWGVALSIPWITLAVLVLVTILSGIVAGMFPARRAARLDPLIALSYE